MKHSIPANSLLYEEWRLMATYTDSFTVLLKRTDIAGWELLAALLHSTPPWFDALACLRDKMVCVFGLKPMTGNMRLPPVPPYLLNQRIGYFRVMQICDREILLGDEDKHLDFCLSLLLTPQLQGMELTVTTVVATRNLLGRIYFAIVKHVHRLGVPIILRAMARTIDNRLLPSRFYQHIN